MQRLEKIKINGNTYEFISRKKDDKLKLYKRDEPFIPTEVIGLIIGVEKYNKCRGIEKYSELEDKKSTSYFMDNMQDFFKNDL